MYFEYNKEARTKPKSVFRRKRGDFCNNLFDIWCPPIHCFHCVWIVIGHFFLNCHFDRRIRNLWWCAETTIEPNPFRCKYETVLTVAPIEIPLSHLQIRTHNGFSSSIYPLSGELFSMQRRYRSSGGYFKWIKTQKSGTTMTLLLIIVWRRWTSPRIRYKELPNGSSLIKKIALNTI